MIMKDYELPPYAPILMESTRAIGYSLEAAIADIVDNSITAMASIVKINFFPIDGEYVSILDNGIGMDSNQINRAMQYGSQNPNECRTSNDLGRFGLGLKTASLSQCRVLTVISKYRNHIESRQWDLDYIAQTCKWSLKILNDEEIAHFPGVQKLRELETGTLVIWQSLDRMKLGETNFELAMGRKMDEVKKHLSLVYHRYLSGEAEIRKIKIYFNEVSIKPTDPFLENKSLRAMDDENIILCGNKVVVRPYILPHISRLTSDEIEMLGGREGLRKRQGFYVYRNKRLLVWGTWFRMMRQGELSKLVRIRVDIPNALDGLWTLDIKKSSAVPPALVRDNLGIIIEKMAEKSKRTWTYRGKREIDDSICHIWNRFKMRNGGVLYEINREYPLIEELSKQYPDIRRKMDILFKQIEENLPLNTLYLDLVNDEKIDNDTQGRAKEIIAVLEEILCYSDEKDKQELLEALMISEPFCSYADDINNAVARGDLL